MLQGEGRCVYGDGADVGPAPRSSITGCSTCLLANTSSTAPSSSSSASIRISSSLASPTRSRSLLSTTKMMPGKRRNR
ncbi:hypothetical protein EYF80_054513 [Liparis tanakae]|uniref:Uncharacterized protein n=1 Tax=Liparis tanakae TaxID=230148 RepID=A0A4Z2F3S0_9TELE|nr:hypothetical protein EYF80_054513 [Liparis tanakae]